MRQYVGDDEDLPRWNWEEIGGGVVLDQNTLVCIM